MTHFGVTHTVPKRMSIKTAVAFIAAGLAMAARSGGIGTAADVLRKQLEDGASHEIVGHVEALRQQVCTVAGDVETECQRLLLDPMVVDCLAKGVHCNTWHLDRAKSPNICTVDLPAQSVACQPRSPTPKATVLASKCDMWQQSTSLTINPHGDYAACWTHERSSQGIIGSRQVRAAVSKAGCPLPKHLQQ